MLKHLESELIGLDVCSVRNRDYAMTSWQPIRSFLTVLPAHVVVLCLYVTIVYEFTLL